MLALAWPHGALDGLAWQRRPQALVNRAAAGCNRYAMDDDELIAALAAGDDAALRELFTRHAPWLAARLRAALPPPDVEDVLQETFLAVWRGARGYRPDGRPRAWLWVIARNQAALLLRRRGPVAASLEEIPLAGGTDPAEAALARAEIAAALAGPEGDVLRLMYVEDRPVAEVAALLGVPAGTVKSRAHRARRMLRTALGGTR
jgi:RNA polymerase sigma-70 factor (ECF subfamily)